MPDLLSLLPETHRVALLQEGRRRRYHRRATVMQEGEAAGTAHLILTGHLGIRMTTPRGDEATIGVRGPGELVGEMALIDSNPKERSATVLALDASETLVIRRGQFERLRADVPAVGDWMLQVLSDRLRETSRQLLDALYQPAEIRIYRRLLDVAAAFGSPDIVLTQDDLAAMAGTTRSTVNRTLQAAQSSGLLVLSRGKVTLLDRDGLLRRGRVEADNSLAGTGSSPESP